ncbi:MAG: hypothetical protein RR840_07145 [Clostridium sp.]
MKIGVIVSVWIEEHLRTILSEAEPHIDIEYITYKDFGEIDSISQDIEDNYDGFLIWGVLTEMIVKRNFKDCTNIKSTFLDPLGLSKTLLKMYMENPGIKLSEIYIDFLISKDQVDIELIDDIVDLRRECYTSDHIRFNKWDPDEFDTAFHSALDKHLTLHNEGKVKVSITHFSNIVLNGLKENNIKHYFCYPSKEHVLGCFNELVTSIKIKGLNNVQPEIIQITIDNISLSNPREINEAELKYLLLEHSLISFGMEHNYDFKIKRNFYNMEILVPLKDIKSITNNFTCCSLISYLSKILNFNISIGYGIGGTLADASNNSFLANKEASLIKESCSYLMNEEKTLIGPFTRSQQPIIVPTSESPYIHELSKQTQLSPFTISKIISVMKLLNTNVLTSDNLAYKLNITKRSANRFLSKLEENGKAELIEVPGEGLRGRPKKKYRIDIDYNKA